MARRLLFAIVLLMASRSFAPPTTAEKNRISGDCPLEIMSENARAVDVPASKNFGEAPFPIDEIKGAFDAERITELRALLNKMGLDFEPGKEYLHDSENAVRGYDQWKADLDKILENRQMRQEAEKFLLQYLQNAPLQADGERFHPGWSPEVLLPRHESIDDYYADKTIIKTLDALAGTLENTVEFRNVLMADTYRDPARRSRTITQMRAAYLVSSLMRARRPKTSKYLDEELGH